MARPTPGLDVPLTGSSGAMSQAWYEYLQGANASLASNTASIASNTAAIAVLAAPACFSATKGGTDQTGIANNTWTQVTFGTELYDVGNHFTSNAWTPPAGKVHINTQAIGSAASVNTTSNQFAIAVYKNGVLYKQGDCSIFGGTLGRPTLSFDDSCNGTDVYTVYMIMFLTAGTGTILGTAAYTFFNGHWFSA